MIKLKSHKCMSYEFFWLASIDILRIFSRYEILLEYAKQQERSYDISNVYNVEITDDI